MQPRIPYIIWIQVQRLSHGMRVKPQANGGRTILGLYIYRLINSLCSFLTEEIWNRPYIYSCDIDEMITKICPVCHTKVIFKDDDVSIFGWLVLKDKYFVIHPNLYSSLECFIGPTRMSAIIKPIVNVDSDGKIITIGEPNMKKDEPFRGIGMIAFKERFQEIMDYYYNKWPNKKPIYDDLMLNKNIIFTHSIPVFSALLRPSILESGSINTSPISW